MHIRIPRINGALTSFWLPVLGFVVLSVLLLVYLKNYLLFHTVVEGIRILVAVCIFLFAWNTRTIMKNSYFTFISIALLFVGIITFIHMISYRGMNILSGYNANTPTQLWILGQYLMSIAFLISPSFIIRKIPSYTTLAIFGVITLLGLTSILYWRNFPASFVEGYGLTGFKIVSEYVISLLFIGAIFRLFLNKHHFNPNVYSLMSNSLYLSVLAELCFTLYRDVYGILNASGHILILIGYYLMYRAIIEIGLKHPYQLMFLEIQRLSQQKDDFLNIASHELKTPVTSIKVFAQLLEKNLAKDNVKLAGYARNINKQTNHINKMVNEFLDVTRMESEKLVYSKERFDLAALTKDILNEKREVVKSHSLQAKLNGKMYVFADKARIKQVIDNYIANAVKYSPKGTKITLETRKERGSAILSVKDRGVGIPAEHLDKVFDKYYRSQEGNKGAEGLGLGLYIVKQIISEHDGKVWAESESTIGSVFYFSLPLIQQQKPAQLVNP